MGFFNFIAELLSDPRSAIAAQIAAGPLAAYGFVFIIVFVETGVVFFPFLPGDSLLFASGFFAQNGGFNIFVLLGVAWAAAIIGDQCNFFIGHFLGRKIIDSGKVKAMTPERMEKSEAFLDKWGNLAIFLGRFFPFIRTFVPFLAGLGGMRWHNFIAFNILGGVTWSTLFVLLGYFFGGIPVVQEHFELLIVGIIVLSLIPSVVGLIRSRLNKGKQTDGVQVADTEVTNVVESTAENFVEPTAENFVEPTAENFVEPTAENFVEPEGKSIVEPEVDSYIAEEVEALENLNQAGEL